MKEIGTNWLILKKGKHLITRNKFCFSCFK